MAKTADPMITLLKKVKLFEGLTTKELNVIRAIARDHGFAAGVGWSWSANVWQAPHLSQIAFALWAPFFPPLKRGKQAFTAHFKSSHAINFVIGFFSA